MRCNGTMLYLIDASVYIFRAWFALPEMKSPQGAPVQAVYGLAGMLAGLLEQAAPGHIACCFDESLTTSFRNERWPDYKAGRELPPPELEAQLKDCRRLARALGMVELASPRYEADDLIGALATKHREAAGGVTLVSSDKDLMQLMRPGDWFWNLAANEKFGFDDVQERLGVPPAQVAELLGLAGDPVDGIPGVRGIGRKTAAALLAHFPDLDALYEDLEAVAALPVRGAKGIARKLAEQRDIAFLSRELATIHVDIPLALELEDLRWRRPDRAAVEALFDELGFGGRLRERILALKH